MKTVETLLSALGIKCILIGLIVLFPHDKLLIAAPDLRFKRVLKAEFADARLRRMLHPGLHLNLAEEIYNWDPNKGFIRKDIFRNYIKDLDEFKKCLDALNVARSHLSKMPKSQWIVIVDEFHRDLATRLSSLDVTKKWKFFRFEQSLSLQENIADTPEGEILVSGKDGRVSHTELDVLFNTRRFPWGRYGYGFSVHSRNYLDQTMNSRDLLRSTFHVTGNYKSSLEKVDFIEVGFAFAGDVFETNGESEWTISHFIPSLKFIYKPLDLSTILFKGVSSESFFEIDSKAYLGSNTTNAFNQNKDTLSFKAMQSVKFSKVGHIKDSDLYLFLGLQSQNSDAEEFNYFSILMNLSYETNIKSFDVTPYFKLKTRMGMDYLQTQSRDDWYNRLGFVIGKPLFNDRAKLRLDVSRENNHSNVSSFDYDNHKIVLEAECRW